MNIRALGYFVKIAEAGSFSAAARQLRVAQPALTRHIRNLERELGVSLFERTSRGLIMSDAARQLFSDGCQILADLERAKTRVQQFATVIAGEVTLAITPSVSLVLINPLVKNLEREAPYVSLHFVESMAGNGSEWLDWVRDGHLDFAIMYGSVNPSGLKLNTLAVEDLHFVGKTNDLEQAAEIQFSGLHQYPLVLPSRIHPLRQVVDKAAQEAGISLRIAREVDSLLEVKSIVRREGLCSILASCAVWEEREHGELFARRIVKPSLPRRLDVITLPDHRLRPAARLTESIIRSTAGDLINRGRWAAVLSKS